MTPLLLKVVRIKSLIVTSECLQCDDEGEQETEENTGNHSVGSEGSDGLGESCVVERETDAEHQPLGRELRQVHDFGNACTYHVSGAIVIKPNRPVPAEVEEG